MTEIIINEELGNIEKIIHALEGAFLVTDFRKAIKDIDQIKKKINAINAELRIYKSRYKSAVSELELEKSLNEKLETHLKDFGDVVKSHNITSEIMRNNENKKVYTL